jgi:hypothetical protein
MRRVPNTGGRNYSSASGGSGDRAQTDKTLEERETDYAKARARIFNENPSTTTGNNNASNNTSTNNGSSDSNVTTTTPDDITNGDNMNNNSTNTNNIKDQSDAGINVSQKRGAASNAPAKSRRGFTQDGADGPRKYADAGFSDMSFYSQEIAPYRDKVTYNPKDQTLSLNDGGFMMDGKDRCACAWLCVACVELFNIDFNQERGFT